MLAAIGAKNIEDLFDEIPKELRIESLAGIPDALNEMQTGKLMMARAAQDGTPLNFIGAGAYEHHIPSAVWAVTTRGEFYSAYTPYQAEASQGTLQLIYEYQTMISSLTGMEVSNASLYDGGSAVAEASLMAIRAHRKSQVAAHPRADHRASELPQGGGGHRQRAGRAFRRSALPEGIPVGRGSDEVRGRGHHRHRHPAAELLRRARRRRCHHRLGACQRHSWSSLGESHLARHSQTAGRVGHEGRRHRLRRLPAARRAAVLGRSVRGLPHHARWNTCARCRAASSAAPSTPTGSRASRSRCRRASSTSAAARPRRTSAPTRACWSRPPRSI